MIVKIFIQCLQEGKSEIVASKFGDRSSYACIAATASDEFSVGLPAKQGIARNESLTVVNNFQFLNIDLTDEEIDLAVSSRSCSCKVNKNPLQYELSKGDDISTDISPFGVAVHLLKNIYGKFMASIQARRQSQYRHFLKIFPKQRMRRTQPIRSRRWKSCWRCRCIGHRKAVCSIARRSARVVLKYCT